MTNPPKNLPQRPYQSDGNIIREEVVVNMSITLSPRLLPYSDRVIPQFIGSFCQELLFFFNKCKYWIAALSPRHYHARYPFFPLPCLFEIRSLDRNQNIYPYFFFSHECFSGCVRWLCVHDTNLLIYQTSCNERFLNLFFFFFLLFFFFGWPHLSPLTLLPLMRLYCQPLLVSSHLLLKSNSFHPSSFRYDSKRFSLVFNSAQKLSGLRHFLLIWPKVLFTSNRP